MAGTPFSWAPTVDVWREHENALCLLDDPTFLLFAGNRKPWTTLAPEMHRALREPAEKLSSGQLSSMFTLNYKNSAKNSERWLRIMELVTTMRTEKRIIPLEEAGLGQTEADFEAFKKSSIEITFSAA